MAEYLPHVVQVMRLAPGLQTIVLTLGANGVLLASREPSASSSSTEPRCTISLQHLAALKADVVNVNGAGSSMA